MKQGAERLACRGSNWTERRAPQNETAAAVRRLSRGLSQPVSASDRVGAGGGKSPPAWVSSGDSHRPASEWGGQFQSKPSGVLGGVVSTLPSPPPLTS